MVAHIHPVRGISVLPECEREKRQEEKREAFHEIREKLLAFYTFCKLPERGSIRVLRMRISIGRRGYSGESSSLSEKPSISSGVESAGAAFPSLSVLTEGASLLSEKLPVSEVVSSEASEEGAAFCSSAFIIARSRRLFFCAGCAVAADVPDDFDPLRASFAFFVFSAILRSG